MSKTSQKWGQESTEIELKSRCLFSKCFHGPKREPKKPLNKGLQGDFVLFELLIYIIISDIYYIKYSNFGLFHLYYPYLILFIIFFVAKIVATVMFRIVPRG